MTDVLLIQRSVDDDVEHLVYVKSKDQIRELKKLFVIAKTKDIEELHYRLGKIYQDCKCSECSDSCKWPVAERAATKDPQKWNSSSIDEQITQMLREIPLETPNDWVNLLDNFSQTILYDFRVNWGVLHQ